MSNKLNHFLEIQRGDDGHIWAMVHSGSRNLGKKVADYYIKEAVKYTEEQDVYVPKNWELAYLDLNSEMGMTYFNEMTYCVEFAKSNRQYMINCILESIKDVISDAKYEKEYDVTHNYASVENHFGESVIVHRKGATYAGAGSTGLIPGSQGTASYVVEGRGNPNSFMSCSHGSGRKMGRGVAKRMLSLDYERAILDNQGIIHDMKSIETLDEAPGAYKNIEDIMRNQIDLVKPLVKLVPLAVVKG